MHRFTHAIGSLVGSIQRHSSRRETSQDAEMMRLQILGNPDLLRQVQEVRRFPIFFIPFPGLALTYLYDRPNPSWHMRRYLRPRDSLSF